MSRRTCWDIIRTHELHSLGDADQHLERRGLVIRTSVSLTSRWRSRLAHPRYLRGESETKRPSGAALRREGRALVLDRIVLRNGLDADFETPHCCNHTQEK